MQTGAIRTHIRTVFASDNCEVATLPSKYRSTDQLEGGLTLPKLDHEKLMSFIRIVAEAKKKRSSSITP